KFKNKIKNVALVVEDWPSRELLTSQGLGDNETLLGFYYGIPSTARGADYGVGPTLPDTITIFQGPTEEEAGGDPERVREIVKETIWHEYAHYFGIDDHGIEKLPRKF
ncbi:MAG: metallopeptidase family protein, partial [Patescibacteria group bacterium]